MSISGVARNYVYEADPSAGGARIEAPALSGPGRVWGRVSPPQPTRRFGASWAPQWVQGKAPVANAFSVSSRPQNASRSKKKCDCGVVWTTDTTIFFVAVQSWGQRPRLPPGYATDVYGLRTRDDLLLFILPLESSCRYSWWLTAGCRISAASCLAESSWLQWSFDDLTLKTNYTKFWQRISNNL